ncbi:MAG: hypothetical protein AB7H81_04230 [Vicinamibacterales bacterium]
MTIVELCIGSADNPWWQLDRGQESELQRVLANAAVVPAGTTVRFSPAPAAIRRARSGYQGMILRPGSADSPLRGPLLVAWDEVAPGFIVSDGGQAIERWLFETAPPELRTRLGLDFAELVERTGELFGLSGLTGPPRPGLACAGAPAFEPHTWFEHSLNNNCYSYARDRLGRRWPPLTPGGGSMPRWTCEILQELLAEDGLGLLSRSDEPAQCPPGGHVIAVCLDHAPGGTFHCLRRDGTGFWSHKLSTAGFVTHLDDEGKMMPTLHDARFLAPMSLCGFFSTPQSGRSG